MKKGFEPRNPNYQERTRRGFDGQRFLTHLGARLIRVQPGSVEIHLPDSPDLTQQHGYFHGGAIGTIADVCGGFAAFTLMSETQSVLTVEYKLNIMAPAKGDYIVGRGQVIKSGRTLSVARADIFAVQDGKETLSATMLGTFMGMQDNRDVVA